MSCYISSNDNRIYSAGESAFNLVPMATAENLLPALGLKVKHTVRRPERKDKGGRTFRGTPAGLRTATEFALRTYMSSWDPAAGRPAHDALIVSAMGRSGDYHPGGTAASVSGCNLRFATPHELQVQQAVACGGEIRFVAAVEDDYGVVLNAPLTRAESGSQFGPTITYRLGPKPRSATIFDYWSPADAVQRVIPGCVADSMRIRINGDYHECDFAGPAADVIDSDTFAAGQGGIELFPAEPDWTGTTHSVIPGHLGQVWMGVVPGQVQTLTEADVLLTNNVDLRTEEFGQSLPRCFTAGVRKVAVRFTIAQTGEAETRALYQASRHQLPISVMFQLGQAEGQLCGVYMKSLVPEVPEFEDGRSCLEWKFGESRAQGAVDDELVVAFA